MVDLWDIMVFQELACGCGETAISVAAHTSLGMYPIFSFGSEEQKKKYVPKLASGEWLGAFGLTEPGAGSDAGNTQTTAKKDGDDWIINGSKIFITNSSSEMAGVCIVQAITGTQSSGKSEISCIIVPHGTPGFRAVTMKGKMIWRASDTGQLFFGVCRLPQENLLGARGEVVGAMVDKIAIAENLRQFK